MPSTPRRVTLAALALILTSSLVRIGQLSQRTLYWDDLVIPSFFGDVSPTAPSTWGGLFRSYDGHIMPASAALQATVQQLAPLRWWLPALIIVLATAACGWLWWRVALRLQGPGIPALATLALLLYSPFLMSAAGWWSTAVNAFAWQAGMAGCVLCVLAARATEPSATHSAPHSHAEEDSPTGASPPTAVMFSPPALALTAVVFAALLFTEKALSLVPAAFVIALLVQLPRRRLAMFVLPALLWLLWLLLYLRLVDIPETENPGSITGAIPSAVFRGIIPGVAGGPLWWERWQPSTAFAATPWVWSVLTVIATLAVVAVWLRRGTRLRVIALVAIVGYVAALLIALVRARAGYQSSGVLTLNLHYYADWFAFAVVAVAACPPSRRASSVLVFARRHLRLPTSLPVVGVTVFVIASLISTATWVWAWRDDPNEAYLTNLRNTVYADGTPFLEQPVPLEVLLPIVEPYNRISHVTGVPAVSGIDRAEMIGESGRVVEAGIIAVASNEQSADQGSEPGCGTRIMAGQQRAVVLSRALPFGEWTWQLNAAATAPVEVRITTPNGLETLAESEARASTVHVGTDLRPQWVRVSGGGGFIALRVSGPEGASLCVGRGDIGPLVPVS